MSTISIYRLRSLLYVIVLIVIVLEIVGFGYNRVQYPKSALLSGFNTSFSEQYKTMRCLRNYNLIDNAIREYIVAIGVAPVEISQLVDEGFLKEIPINPYSKKPIRNIRISENVTLGDITYIPSLMYIYDTSRKTHDGSNLLIGKKYRSFWLIGYGDPASAISLRGNLMGPATTRVIYMGGTTGISKNRGGTSIQFAYQRPEEVLAQHGYTWRTD